MSLEVSVRQPLRLKVSCVLSDDRNRDAYDTVVFDLDGTLADTADDLTAAMNHTLRLLDLPPLPLEDVRHLCGDGARAMMSFGLNASGRSEDWLLDRSIAMFLDFYRENVCVGTRPYDGLPGALERLKGADLRLAVCTNKSAGLAKRLIDELGWTNQFDAIVGGDTLPERKPNAAPLLEAIHRAGGNRGVYVGDAIVDLRCASAAGVPFIAVDFGFLPLPVRVDEGAAAVITHYDQLDDALKSCA